jgi:hypothetical protein
MTTYRAAYWLKNDGQREVVLTAPEHADLSDDELMAEAEQEARNPAGMNGRTDGGRIVIGEWTED